MLLFKLTIYQLIFIIAVPIILILVGVFFIYLPIRRHYIKKNYDEYYYKTIRRIVNNQDYFLINKFIYKIDDAHTGKIDHIIFGDKYIYIITAKYYDGDIKGAMNDKSLILYNRNAKKCYISNPYTEVKRLLDSLSLNTDIDDKLMIGIVVVNKGVNIHVESQSKQYYAIQINKLPQLIKAIESREIPTINETQLAKAVKVFDKLNRRRD